MKQVESRSFSNNSSASCQRPAALAAHRAALQLAMLGVRPARIISLDVCFKLMLSQYFAKPQFINKGCTNFGAQEPTELWGKNRFNLQAPPVYDRKVTNLFFQNYCFHNLFFFHNSVGDCMSIDSQFESILRGDIEL